MKYEKRVLAPLDRAYSTNNINLNDREYILYASEANVAKPGDAYAFPLDDLEDKKVVWNDVGGCMSMLSHPYKSNSFVAIQEFYLKETPSRSKLVEVTLNDDGSWSRRDLIKLPFLHRFGFIKSQDEVYIICCTIAKDKQNKDDWSKPGEVWAGVFPKEDGKEIELSLLSSGYFRNHGMNFNKIDGNDVIFISSDEGVYKIYHDNKIVITKIMDGAVGDIAFSDIDGDGRLEMLTIEPFHGSAIKLYHLDENGKYKCIWQYENKIDFAHALAGDKLCGHNCFVAGIRREDAECIVIYMQDGQVVYDVVDQGGGPANLCVIHYNDKEYISCSNHTAGECVIYEVME